MVDEHEQKHTNGHFSVTGSSGNLLAHIGVKYLHANKKLGVIQIFTFLLFKDADSSRFQPVIKIEIIHF